MLDEIVSVLVMFDLGEILLILDGDHHPCTQKVSKLSPPRWMMHAPPFAVSPVVLRAEASWVAIDVRRWNAAVAT